MNEHVALDGPVASGKTVAAKALAARLGALYLDTGAMYRAVAALALEQGVDLDNERGLVTMLGKHTIDVIADPAVAAGYRVLIDRHDTGTRLFDPPVAAAVSTVAALALVRAELVERQRVIAAQGPVVMAGRDIGTVVLPDARFKFFLTASVEERARRRFEEFRERGIETTLDDVREQIAQRDRIDTTRAIAPLMQAPDAVRIDSTALTPDAVIEHMVGVVEGLRR